MDKENFAQLVWESRDTMYRVAKSILYSEADCEDAVSQAIVNGFSRLSSLKKDEYARTWLIRIEIRECCKLYRLRRREESYETYEQKQDSRQGFVLDCGKEEYSDLYQAMLKLPLEYRVALVLYYLDGYSIKEIAQIQKTTAGTVKSRLSRGRQKLKKLLTEYQEEESYEKS
ncbi:MAG: sigma-70 family RNA polymerase sigma factor [Eubacteriales bacterium]|nr:sigma-70 family RNA polymerase sigma factor [Eubacteriales bacterium]